MWFPENHEKCESLAQQIFPHLQCLMFTSRSTSDTEPRSGRVINFKNQNPTNSVMHVATIDAYFVATAKFSSTTESIFVLVKYVPPGMHSYSIAILCLYNIYMVVLWFHLIYLVCN